MRGRSLTRLRRAPSLLFALAFLAVGLCFAQISPAPANTPPAQAPPVEVNVSRVLIPVVVRDKQGHAIGDLTESDFTVFDNGKKRPLSGFSIERHLVPKSASPASAGTHSTPAAPPPPGPASAVSGLPDRIIVLLFDDLGLDEEDLAHAKQAALAALPGMLTGSTMAAVVNLSGSVNSGITRDPAKLDAAISRIEPNPIFRSAGTGCPKISYYQADLIADKHDDAALADATSRLKICQPNTPGDLAVRLAQSTARQEWSVGRQRIQVTYDNMGEWVQRMAKLPGQRILLLISPGFLPLGADGALEESQAIQLAAGTGVIISALDASGLYTTGSVVSADVGQATRMEQEYARTAAMMAGTAMGALAEGTGGGFFENSNDLTAGLRSLTAGPETIYLLELSLNGVKRNGAYHRLRVKVHHEGVDIQARRGYFVPKAEKKKKGAGFQSAPQQVPAGETPTLPPRAQAVAPPPGGRAEALAEGNSIPSLQRRSSQSPAPISSNAAASAAAQPDQRTPGVGPGPPAAQSDDTVEGLIHLDVVVTDATGSPVPGLGAGNLTVLDNGHPEPNRSFAAFRRDDAMPVILVLDTLGIPDELTQRERLAAIAFLRENGGRLTQPTAIFSVTTTGLWMVADLSRDGKKLADDLEHHREAGLVRPFPNPLPRDAGQALPPTLEALQALGQIATTERRLPGRKLLLWLGPGAGMGSDAYASRVGPVSDTFFTICWFSLLLRDARVTLDTISAGQLDPSQKYLAYVHGTTLGHADPIYLSREVLAVESGGQVMDGFDLVAELNRCVREAGTYYALSFDPAPTAHDEEYHTIRVAVSRPGLTARTTTGYYDEPYYSDQPRPGVRRLTVAAMDALMPALRAEPNGAAAEQLAGLQLTEPASDATVARWTAELHGKKARTVLLGLTDAAEFLPLPPGQASRDPAPDAMAQWAILARAQTYLKETIPKLPNFFARRTTVHYEESAQYRQDSLRVDYHPLHVAETTRETVVYRHGAEIVASGARGHAGMRPWLTTYGTFGPVLEMVRDAQAHGVIWSRWDEEAGIRVAVFRFAIPLAASHYYVSGCCRPDGDGRSGFGGFAAYHGEIAIDPASGAILRIEADADLDESGPLEASSIVVRYGPVEIGGKTYICPLSSISLWRSLSESTLQDWDEKFLTWGPYESTVNDIRYSDYHMFQARARILPGVTKQEP